MWPGLSLKEPRRRFLRVVPIINYLVGGNALQNVKRANAAGRHAREPHHYAVGVLGYGGVDELLHHEGGAVVYVDCFGEVENNDLVVSDVAADGVISLLEEATVKVPLSATKPTLAEKMSVSSSPS